MVKLSALLIYLISLTSVKFVGDCVLDIFDRNLAALTFCRVW